MSFSVYKIIHIAGVAGLLMALSSATWLARLGNTDEGLRKKVGMSHGIALLLMLVAGFGMLAKAHISFSEPWVIAKIVLWFVMGGFLAGARKQSDKPILLTSVILVTIAAALAILRPI